MTVANQDDISHTALAHRIRYLARPQLLVITVVVFLVALFLGLGKCIYPVDHCLSLDRAIHEMLTAQPPRGFGTLMRFGHLLSDLPVLLAPLLVVWVAVQRQFGRAALVVASEAGAYILHLLLKDYFQRSRPGDIIPPWAPPSAYLFPSGHTVGAIVVFGLCAYLIAEGRSRPVRRLVALSATIIIGLAVTSLVYFDNHYATDVIGGLLIGGAWLAGSILLLRATRLSRTDRGRW